MTDIKGISFVRRFQWESIRGTQEQIKLSIIARSDNISSPKVPVSRSTVIKVGSSGSRISLFRMSARLRADRSC